MLNAVYYNKGKNNIKSAQNPDFVIMVPFVHGDTTMMTVYDVYVSFFLSFPRDTKISTHNLIMLCKAFNAY